MKRLLAVFLSTMFSAAAAQEPDVVEIMHRAFKAVKLDGAEATARLLIFDGKGNQRERQVVTVSKLYDDGATEKRLIRFLAPPDVKGTGLLTYDYEKKSDDMWLFMPALRKTRRIVAAEKAKSFMGSEFSYADITPPPVEDFEHKLLRSEKAGEVECWVIESIPRNEDIAQENGFSRKLVWIGKPDYVIRRAQQFGFTGELEKELEVKKVEEIDREKHRFRPTHMVMHNRKNGRSSEMIMDEVRLRLDIPEEYFTTRYLERP